MIKVLSSKTLFVEYVLKKAKARDMRMSKREIECIYYLIRGMTIKRIGRVLGLSPRTVESYVMNVRNRFHCSSRHELIEKVLGIA